MAMKRRILQISVTPDTPCYDLHLDDGHIDKLRNGETLIIKDDSNKLPEYKCNVTALEIKDIVFNKDGSAFC